MWRRYERPGPAAAHRLALRFGTHTTRLAPRQRAASRTGRAGSSSATLPAPDLLLILDAPATCSTRASPSIRPMSSTPRWRYRDLAGRLPRAELVDATRSPEAVLDDVVSDLASGRAVSMVVDDRASQPVDGEGRWSPGWKAARAVHAGTNLRGTPRVARSRSPSVPGGRAHRLCRRAGPRTRTMLERVASRWPVTLDGSDTAGAVDVLWVSGADGPARRGTAETAADALLARTPSIVVEDASVDAVPTSRCAFGCRPTGRGAGHARVTTARRAAVPGWARRATRPPSRPASGALRWSLRGRSAGGAPGEP
jgi:hypothetical protein